MQLDTLQDCKIVSTNKLEKMFQPLRSVAGSIYRASCTKSIYVCLVKFGRGLGTPLLDLYFIQYGLGSLHSKWPLGVQCFM